MPRVLKRRADAEASPSPPTQRRRSNSADAEVQSDLDGDGTFGEDAGGTHDQMVKKLVRLALACEFTRQPLRRADISQKVLHPNPRAFNAVFAGAQDALRSTFGMTLTELPIKEKHTLQQKRAAQRAGHSIGGTQSQSSASKAYILTSTLPSSFRKIPIMQPAKIPSVEMEAGYTGLYTFVVSVIMLSVGQRISDGKLMRLLQKVNAEEMVLEGEKTDKVLKKMEREGYIVKIKEREVAGGEETIDWVVGPRGKVEVGERGVAGLVKGVYGKTGQEMEELEDRMEKSLGRGTFRRKTKRVDEGRGEQNGDAQEQANGQVDGEDPQEEDSGTRARPAPAYRGTARPSKGASREQTRAEARAAPRRSSRRSNGLVNDEAEGEEEEEGDEEDEGEDLEDEEEEEGDDGGEEDEEDEDDE